MVLTRNSNLEKLEYQKIIDKLVTYCKTYVGRGVAEHLLPLSDAENVKLELCKTTQAVNMVLRYGSAPIGEFEELSKYIKNLESYMPLSPKGLLEIAKILKIAGDLKEYFSNAEDNSCSSKNEAESFEFKDLVSDFDVLYANPRNLSKHYKICIG